MPDFLSTYCHLRVLYVLGLSLDTLLLAPRNGVTDCTLINSRCPQPRFRYDIHTHTHFVLPSHLEQGIILSLNTARNHFRRLNFCACLPQCLSFSCPLQGTWCRTMQFEHQMRRENVVWVHSIIDLFECTCTNTFIPIFIFHPAP